MTANTEKEFKKLPVHLYSVEDSNEIVSHGEAQPRIPEMMTVGLQVALAKQLETKKVVGFIGFDDERALETFRSHHIEAVIQVGRKPNTFPFSVYLSPAKTGLYVLRNPEVGPLIGSNESEFECYLEFLSSHWEALVHQHQHQHQ